MPTQSKPEAGRALLVAGLVVLLAAALATPAGAQDGFRLGGLGGGALSEADLARGTTIVVVWASWSPRCRDIVERVNRIEDSWGGKTKVMTVNFQEERGAVEAAARGLRVPTFLDADGVFSKRHSVFNLPGLLVFVDGSTAYSGKLPDDPGRVLGEILR